MASAQTRQSISFLYYTERLPLGKSVDIDATETETRQMMASKYELGNR